MVKYIKSSAWGDVNGVKFSGKDLRDFKAMLNTIEHQYRDVQLSHRGNWEMGTGGYDEWYWINYNDIQVISCVAGRVKVDNGGDTYESEMTIRKYAKLFADSYGYRYDYITAHSVIDKLNYGEEVDVLTDDGYEVSAWMDEVSFGNAWEDKLCMFIQVDEGGRSGKEVAYAGDIESASEFEIERTRLLKELSNK